MRPTILLGLVTTVASLAVLPAAAQAHPEDTVSISVSSLVTGAENTEHKMYTKALPNGHYDVTVVAKSENANRPESSIIVRSGKQEVRLDNVERKDFKEQKASHTLHVTDGSATVYVKLGRDKLFSSDRDIQLHKADKPRTAPAVAAAPTQSTRPAELPRTGTEPLLIAGLLGVAGYAAHIAYQRYRPARR